MSLDCATIILDPAEAEKICIDFSEVEWPAGSYEEVLATAVRRMLFERNHWHDQTELIRSRAAIILRRDEERLMRLGARSGGFEAGWGDDDG